MIRNIFLTTLAIVTLIASSSHLQADDLRSSRPNILFAIADDASWKHFGAYGATWIDTPHFDQLAANGLLFTKAYTPNAKCGPSRTALLTGRNSWQLEELANHWVDYPVGKYQTYHETLDKNGYHVGYTGKGWSPGDPGTLPNGKKRALLAKTYNQAKLNPPAEYISNIDYTENFRNFLADRQAGQPFCFWYGSNEPHRAYEYGAGIKYGNKQLSDIPKVPEFWPDTEEVRTDMLDYAYEIEWFDKHLGNMIEILRETGELDNTLIIVTSDNGMPFPRVKGQEYEYSNHMPFAIMWPKGITRPGRIIDDYVSFIDVAPTILELAQVDGEAEGMAPITGKSLTSLLYSDRSGRIDPARNYALIGKERHDIGRPNDTGYPIRGIFKDDFLLLQNFKTERWPAGHPQTGYMNIDKSPTKTAVLEARYQPDQRLYWQWNVGKRPELEFYDVANDEACIHNLANSPVYQERIKEMHALMLAELEKQNDPRLAGKGDSFDQYEFGRDGMINFFNKLMNGTQEDMGWYNPADVQPEED
ncbi:sulfatase [Pelagicoccus enzymogenes]|uniref:sulfatase family protein n=1 Tax=Pelagicoccus enzymogenes TaxID=2773457 RepID=UPI00280E73E3|nr:sulfatase [Pelagicoccus enzymogenes]MDQ8200131.1 sulfatase [Pelagicoccus enzymogenes]